MPTNPVQFLYPTSRQFPFDAVCEQIVRALERRRWRAADLEISFDAYGSGAQKLRYVNCISSVLHDFEIRFCRDQGRLPGGAYNDIAATSSVRVPRLRLNIYSDESGPTLWTYVGDDWSRDRADFPGGIDAKLHGKPRRYLVYKGDRGYGAHRATRLVPCGDYREYEPEGEEPRSFDTAQVMQSVVTYLRDVALKAIESCPIPTELEEPVDDAPTPLPREHAPLFTYGTPQDARRIAQGKKRLDELPLAERYGMAGNGYRLAPTYIKHGEDLPAVAYDGFLWCARTPTVPDAPSIFFSDKNQLIKLMPKDARGIYVADHAAYEKPRAALGQKIAGKRDHFTNEEVNSFLRARACTIVPLVEYDGNYEEPIYLINRELDFDEVEGVGARKP